MTADELKARTKRFAIDVIRFTACLPVRAEYHVIRGQLVRSATAVGANYRSACRAQSQAHFVHKLAIVEEEADESLYWLEIVGELLTQPNPELVRLLDEANQLTAIIVASRKTARR
jgi:four helix bundle protein